MIKFSLFFCSPVFSPLAFPEADDSAHTHKHAHCASAGGLDRLSEEIGHSACAEKKRKKVRSLRGESMPMREMAESPERGDRPQRMRGKQEGEGALSQIRACAHARADSTAGGAEA